MSLLILNTLPREDEAAQAAIDSLTAAIPESKVFHTREMKISPCIGCNACWLKTPGICALKDDYEEILKAYLAYDEVIFLSGTALGFVDYNMKNVMDRILPLFEMYTFMHNGQMRHVPRYQKQYRFGLLYYGEADGAYMNRWFERVMVNMLGKSLGAFPIADVKEVASCIL